MNEITNKSGLPPINEIMSPRRVARMEAGVPANAALGYVCMLDRQL